MSLSEVTGAWSWEARHPHALGSSLPVPSASSSRASACSACSPEQAQMGRLSWRPGRAGPGGAASGPGVSSLPQAGGRGSPWARLPRQERQGLGLGLFPGRRLRLGPGLLASSGLSWAPAVPLEEAAVWKGCPVWHHRLLRCGKRGAGLADLSPLPPPPSPPRASFCFALFIPSFCFRRRVVSPRGVILSPGTEHYPRLGQGHAGSGLWRPGLFFRKFPEALGWVAVAAPFHCVRTPVPLPGCRPRPRRPSLFMGADSRSDGEVAPVLSDLPLSWQ